MAVRDKMRISAAPFLRDGEEIQAIAGAQTTSQLMAVAGVLPFVMMNRYRMIVATPQRILVLDSGKRSMMNAQGVLAELPRSTMLGPVTGMMWHVIIVNGQKLRVYRRFFTDLETADHAVSTS